MIEYNYNHIQKLICTAKTQYNRENENISLLAVSKKQPLTAIKEAYNLGQLDFGENFVQEGVEKIKELNNKNINWHFIGHIQSNKTRLISENFDWVHTVDRIKIAERLSKQRPGHANKLNICIQINVDDEKTKSGVDIKNVFDLCYAIDELPNLNLRGLMCLPMTRSDHEQQRQPFKVLKKLYEDLNKERFNLDTLSMGMTNDFNSAIQEGSTIIRIGTALFGPRDKS